MSLRELLAEPKLHRRKTWIEWAKENMPQDDFEYFLECLNDSRFSNRYLAIKTTEAGYRVSETTIGNMRRNKLWAASETI